MGPVELVNLAYEEKLFSDKRAGKTPSQTMKSKLSVHIRKNGANSPFVRTGPGRFYLRHLLTTGEKIYDAAPLQAPAPNERVLIFHSSRLDPRFRFQGIKPSWKRLHRYLLDRHECSYMDRLEAEQDNQHKQVLTHIMVTRGKSILAYRRGTFNRVEDFLRGAYCVGFGGHVVESDVTLFNLKDLGLYDSAVRELSEELFLPAQDRARLEAGAGMSLAGVINDDSSPAGRRHLAFLFRYEVSSDLSWDHPRRKEKSITQLQWITRQSDRSLSEFEYWSQLILREFFPDYVHAQPSFVIRRKHPLRPPHVLCILGPVGSGKSEATEVLKNKLGYSEVNSGRILAELLGIPPVSQMGREAFQEASWSFISSRNGPLRLAKAISERVQSLGGGKILIDGVRQRATLECLKIEMGQIGLKVGCIFVHTPADVAYRFYNSRASQKISIHDFLKIREAPVEKETYGMIGVADAVLYNWTGRPRYREIVSSLMQEVL